MIEQLDKNINTFCMRLKEWFSWHFPELTKIVNDNIIFSKLVNFIEKRENINDDMKEQLTDVVLDDEKAQQIIDAAKISMGQELSETDCIQIKKFSQRCVELINFRESLNDYLNQRMNAVAPNLSALVGDIVGSKLIAHAGSLSNLSKYPASTIQILGAEKALFRALKTKGKTPKYGLIFNSTFIGRAQQKNKGRISRYLANKCSIACRVDCYSEAPTNKFGESLKEQMEERLKFLSSGTKPRKNKDVMGDVIEELKKEGLYFGDKVRVAKEDGDQDDQDDDQKKSKKEKKDKKDKKRKHSEIQQDDEEIPEEQPKKKKKKSKD